MASSMRPWEFGPIILGLIVALLVASSRGLESSTSNPGEEEEIPEYEVFHVDFVRVQLPFLISSWILVTTLAKIAFHMTPKLDTVFPESCLLIIVGLVIGVILVFSTEEVPIFMTPDTFFLYLLPPIILEAGYLMPNRLFFDHLGTILLMAVVGTIFNMLTLGGAMYGLGQTGLFGPDPPGILETFLFASLIVAVDPVAVLAVFKEIKVDEILNIVVFGESLLNDAVTVVLYHMFEAYVDMGEENIVTTDIFKGLASFIVVAGGGTVIGIIFGFVTGLLSRFSHHAHVLQPLVVVCMGYMSYLTAEIFHMSGILALTFCGITMKNYVERNIDKESSDTLHGVIEMLGNSAETIIFVFLGVSTVNHNHVWNWWFVVFTIVLCTVFRILGVLLLAALANRYRLHKLKPVDQFVMMYGGLRGAVAFALVLLIDQKKVPNAPMFVTTTVAVIFWTVFVQGITFKPLVKLLKVKTSSAVDPTMNERMAGRMMDFVIWGMEGVWGERSTIRFREIYREWDRNYIQPIMHRHPQHLDPKIIQTFEKLERKEQESALGARIDSNYKLHVLVEESSEDDDEEMFPPRVLGVSKMHQMLEDDMMMPGELNLEKRVRLGSFANKNDSRFSLDENAKKIVMEARRRLSEAESLQAKRGSLTSLGYGSRGAYEDETHEVNEMKQILEDKMMSPGEMNQAQRIRRDSFVHKIDNQLTLDENAKNIAVEAKRRLSEAETNQARRASIASIGFSPMTMIEDETRDSSGRTNRGYRGDSD
eukprot:snap_masked-scaffold1091_size63258-processed-gene-0.9 protein:Tk11572 transcript:snap_masked-scaffold1091_size63258-processed-gene-0.9-mRNA-1 annotation:"sodium hydrogen exchanger 3"